MFETTPPQHSPDSVDLADLDDPVAAVVVVELTGCFLRLCMGQAEPIVARLARHEMTLRKPGGIELDKRIVSQWLYRKLDATVFNALSAAVPLSHAGSALCRVEDLLREQIADVVGTAASYLLSDDRDTAIQMAAVASTMAAREVRSQLAEIIRQTREAGDRDA